MIYFILILFFTSLAAILFMVGRKLSLIKSGRLSVPEGMPFEIPYVKELRSLTLENLRKYEHMALVAVLRFYVQGTSLLKDKYREAKINLKNKIKKNHIDAEKKEVSKFLKIVSDYQHRIREIKHKIKEEEKEL
jgi:hypothetical protein